MEAIFSGTICLCVFRGLAQVEIGAIWQITPEPFPAAHPYEVFLGGAIGLLGAAVAAMFAFFHQRIVMAFFKRFNLLNNSMAIQRALVGSTPMLIIGVCFPQTMFWGEEEFQTVSTASPASELPHVFPTSGLFGYEMDSFGSALLIGSLKIVAISFTVW